MLRDVERPGVPFGNTRQQHNSTGNLGRCGLMTGPPSTSLGRASTQSPTQIKCIDIDRAHSGGSRGRKVRVFGSVIPALAESWYNPVTWHRKWYNVRKAKEEGGARRLSPAHRFAGPRVHLTVAPTSSECDSSQNPLHNCRAYIQDKAHMVRRGGRTLRAGHSSHIPASSRCFNLGSISGSRVECGRNEPFSAIPGGVSHPCPCRRLISSETSVRWLGSLLFCLQFSIVSFGTWHAPGMSAFVVRRTAMPHSTSSPILRGRREACYESQFRPDHRAVTKPTDIIAESKSYLSQC